MKTHCAFALIFNF